MNTQKHINNRKWQVMYIRPNFEKKVASKLKEKAIEHFLPTRTEIRQWHDRKKKIVVPVFPGYLFVKVNEADSLQVYLIDGFVRFLTTGSYTDTLSDKQMAAIKQLFETDYEIIGQPLRTGEPVMITGGPLIGLEGVIEEEQENGRVSVSVEILKKHILVLVDAKHLERIEEQLLEAV